MLFSVIWGRVGMGQGGSGQGSGVPGTSALAGDAWARIDHRVAKGPVVVWASDAGGNSAYVSLEWELLTGQGVDEARGAGWVTQVHPDDREVVQEGLREACLRGEAFWMIYRMRSQAGGYAWVLAGASPSHSPASGEFLGFLGSITPIELLRPIAPHVEIGLLRAAEPVAGKPPKSHLDMLKDLISVACNVAREADEPELHEAVHHCLVLIRKQLNRRPSLGQMLM